MSNDLIAITYTEFDNIVGTQLKYSYPPGAVSKDVFELFSDYVIVAKQLCQRFIVVALDDVIFLNYPISIDNPKYYRNNLTFSFGLVLPRNVDCDPFETMLKKLSSSFANLEIETEFIFQPHSKRLIQDILKTLYESLRDGCEAFIYLTEAKRYLAFKLYKAPLQVSYIRDYDVPMFRHDRINLLNLPWDISFQHLIHRIDGLSHVKKISKEADMDPDFVKRSLSLLAFYDAVVIADVFKFTNVYKLDYEELSDLMSDSAGLFAMQEFCTVDPAAAPDNPTLDQILRFVFKLRPGWSIRDILLEIAAPGSGSDTEASAKKEEEERNRAYSSSSSVSGYSGRTGAGGGNSSRINSMSNPPNYVNNVGSQSHNAGMGFGRTFSFGSTGPIAASMVTPTPGEGLSGLKNIDICRLLSFLCSRKVVRRVHEYPMYVAPTECEMKGADSASIASKREDKSVDSGGGGKIEDHRRRQQQQQQPQPQQQQEEDIPGNIAEIDLKREEAPPQQQHTFLKLSSRSKSVIGRNYLKAGAGEATNSFPISIQEIVQSFNGDECLDSICCTYEVSFNDIVSYPGVYLVYK